MMFLFGFITGIVVYYFLMQWVFYLIGQNPELLDREVENQVTKVLKRIRGTAQKKIESSNPFDINV